MHSCLKYQIKSFHRFVLSIFTSLTLSQYLYNQQQSNLRANDFLLPYQDVIRNNSANPRFSARMSNAFSLRDLDAGLSSGEIVAGRDFELRIADCEIIRRDVCPPTVFFMPYALCSMLYAPNLVPCALCRFALGY